jgi:hypothetical protein
MATGVGDERESRRMGDAPPTPGGPSRVTPVRSQVVTPAGAGTVT